MRVENYLIALAIVLFVLWWTCEGFSVGGNERVRMVVYHYAPWCPACKMMRPRWDAVKNSLRGSGIVLVENDETQRPTQGITGYPSFTLIDANGKRLVRSGVCSPDSLLVWISSPSNFEYTPTGYRAR
jgi:thiol-disulfide isomerase/thioredoxin